MHSIRIRSFLLIPLAAAVFAGPLAGVAQATPPAAGPGPIIAGTAMQGQTLNLTHGTWTGDPPPTVTDQWMYCTSSDPATCTTSISGQTVTTGTPYTLGAGDVGKYLAVVESGMNTDATTMMSTTTPATSNVIGPVVVPPAPTNNSPPTISGTPQVGMTLTHASGTWSDPAATVVDQWWRCSPTCAQITGTTDNQANYVVQAADVGATIEIHETATNAGGPTSADSQPTATVPPNLIAPPGISGTDRIGQTLTEAPASWGGSPTSTSIQWRRCDSNSLTCVDIAGATTKTYTLTDTDLGATLQVAETAAKAGATTTASSPFTGAVADAVGVVRPPAAVPGSTTAIAGSAQLGRTLSGSGAQFNGNPGTFNYQWLRCNALGCLPIPGATDLTYTPTSADVGDSIAFAETASNSGGASDTVQSSRTDTITAPSTTALQTNTSAPVAGQTVTLIATVTSAAGSVKPAGTVDFHSGGAAIPGCAGLTFGNQAPTAVCQTSFPASVANVTAAYSAAPGTFITGSTSSPTTLIVGRSVTSVTVAASAHVSLGAKTTYTATVHPPAGSSLTPTGRVTFMDGGKTIKGCGSRALTANRAPCSVKYLGLKVHRISARYTGDANFAPSAAITSHVLVQPQTPKGFVTVYMNWTFGYGLHSTTIKALSASGISPGIGISLICSGRGCPFRHHKLAGKSRGKCAAGAAKKCAAPSSVNLTPIFGRAHLRVGTTFTVAITHSSWVGKYYRFTIRAGHRPSITESCLAVNGTRPGVGCRAS